MAEPPATIIDRINRLEGEMRNLWGIIAMLEQYIGDQQGIPAAQVRARVVEVLRDRNEDVQSQMPTSINMSRAPRRPPEVTRTTLDSLRPPNRDPLSPVIVSVPASSRALRWDD